MELRKDPITRSWVIVGHREDTCETTGGCPFCPTTVEYQAVLLRLPPQGPWQVAVLPHPDPLYRVEGDPGRRADGIYDSMQPVGADEIVIETPEHNQKLEDLSDDQILMVMDAWRQRIEDLKRDLRFKYVSVYKNYGPLAGAGGSARALANYRNHFRAQKTSLRIARGPRMVQRKRALRVLRHREAGRAPGETDRGHAGRVCRDVPLCLARSV